MKLWQKEDLDPKSEMESLINRFTVGEDRKWDYVLAPYDLQASKAHAKMLSSVGLISKEESKALIAEMDIMLEEWNQGKFSIETEFEDVHSKIEYHLTQKLGDMGKKVHTARSRNDQVLVALQLYIKEELTKIQELTIMLFERWMALAELYKTDLLPGYTHLQIAMPSSFGLWFSAYAETLIDDIYLLQTARKVADQNPLGSAAGYGSSFPIDRQFTTDELGFGDLKYNSIAAQMGRGKVERFTAYALAALGYTLSRFSMDVCLYLSQNFNFISFPKELTTGSSIMPHKKNPDVFELIRGKGNLLQSVPGQLHQLLGNLPSGYHREVQLIKKILISSIEDTKDCLQILEYSLRYIKVRKDILNDLRYDSIFSVENLNEKVKEGIPFRDAYKQLAGEIEQGTYVPSKKLRHTHEGSIGNLSLDKIKQKMQDCLENIRT